MFIKTFKYDFLSVFDKIKYYLIVFVVSAILFKICLLIDMDLILIDLLTGVAGTAYVVCIIGSAIVPLYLCMRRYLKTMLSDEGYLTHCLPVKKSTLLLSKFLNVFVYYAIILIITLVSIFIMLDAEFIELVKEAIVELGYEVFTSKEFWKYLILFMLNAITGSVLFISACSMVLSIGYSFDKGKNLKSFLFGILVYSVYESIISTITFGGIMDIFMSNSEAIEDMLVRELILLSVINIVGIIVTYVINYFMIEKHLNLE